MVTVGVCPEAVPQGRAERMGCCVLKTHLRLLSGVHHSVANAAMVYMFAMPGLAVVGLTTVLIAYFIVDGSSAGLA